MLPQEYARSALKLGLAHKRNLGANPFYFGMVGATDFHTGLVAVAEDNFFGKFRTTEPSAERMFTKMAEVLNENWRLSASGLTGVWAPENTREALFDALRRREVYATTGSRIRLRFFGGWEYEADDLKRIGASDAGYAKGVPMGSALPASGDGQSPNFMLIAHKEPDGADLHALQVIKGWIDVAGTLHERVYDVALAGPAEVDGSAALQSVWSDPDFDAAEDAFYYARVIEVPRPRWTTRDAEYFGVDVPEGAPLEIQDRAYSSPIWYTAAKSAVSVSPPQAAP